MGLTNAYEKESITEQLKARLFVFLYRKLSENTIVHQIVSEEITDAIHPEFGYIWRDAEMGGIAIKQAREEGANMMLDSIIGSLRGYPNCGGDIEVMKEVDRIRLEFPSI